MTKIGFRVEFLELRNHLKALVDFKQCKRDVSVGLLNNDADSGYVSILRRNKNRFPCERSECGHPMDEEVLFCVETGGLIVKWKTKSLSSAELMKYLSVNVADFCVYSFMRCLGYELKYCDQGKRQSLSLERVTEAPYLGDNHTNGSSASIGDTKFGKVESNLESIANFGCNERCSWWPKWHMNEDFCAGKVEKMYSSQISSHFPLSIMKFYPKTETWSSLAESVSLLELPTIVQMDNGPQPLICGEFLKILPAIQLNPDCRISDNIQSTCYSVVKGSKSSRHRKTQDFVLRVVESSNGGTKWKMNEDEVLALFDNGDIFHFSSSALHL